jgi:hypothetical protein
MNKHIRGTAVYNEIVFVITQNGTYDMILVFCEKCNGFSRAGLRRFWAQCYKKIGGATYK